MKLNTKIILFVLGLVAVIGGTYAYLMYSKGHTDVAKTLPAYSMAAPLFFAEFAADETAASAKYSDKIIGLTGAIESIDLSNEKEPQIVLVANGSDGFIRCGFKPEFKEAISKYKPLATISLKGECKGVNSGEGLDLLSDIDVILSNCILID